MSNVIPVPGKAGRLFDRSTGQVIVQTESREDDFFDSVYYASGAMGTSTKELFRDLNEKDVQHVNLETSRRIPASNKLMLSRIGVHGRQTVGNTVTVAADGLKLYDNAVLTFKLNTRLISKRPLFTYQSGYGVSGNTTENNVSFMTLGVPSQAAAPRLEKTQEVSDDDSLNGQITTHPADWISGYAGPSLSAACVVTVFLHGNIEKPLGT